MYTYDLILPCCLLRIFPSCRRGFGGAKRYSSERSWEGTGLRDRTADYALRSWVFFSHGESWDIKIMVNYNGNNGNNNGNNMGLYGIDGIILNNNMGLYGIIRD